MQKIQKHIEIVRTTAPGLSSMGTVSSLGIKTALSKYYATVGISIVTNLADIDKVILKQPDLVFLGVEFLFDEQSTGRFSEDKIWLSNYFESHGIVHTGSGAAAGKLERYKDLAKRRVRVAGYHTADYVVIPKNSNYHFDEQKLKFPLFVKPTNLGGGEGIDSGSVVYTPAELKTRVMLLQSTHNVDVIIEEYLSGREFSVAVMKDQDSGKHLAMPIEIITTADAQGNRILSSEIKSQNQEIVKAVTDLQLRSKLTELALGVFTALEARDYGRIDIRLDAKGEPSFLEANLLPSLLRDYGNFPKACKINIDIDYEQLLICIINLALARSFIEDDFELSVDSIALQPV